VADGVATSAAAGVGGENRSDLRGGPAPAALIDKVEESDAHGDGLGGGQVGTVTPDVPPSLVGRVGGGSVEFDAELVVLVEVVQVPAAIAVPDARLPSGCGQPMRALDATDIPAFEPGQHALTRVVQRYLGLPPHGKLLASVEGGADPLRGSAPLANRLADPVVRLVRARGDLDQVEHCLLDSSAWRAHGWMSSGQNRV